MEIFSFDTNDVEKKLYEINSGIQAMILAVNGLKYLRYIDNDELNALQSILDNTAGKARDIVSSLKPVLSGQDERILLLFGGTEKN